MYCVIQKIKRKKQDTNGKPKELIADYFTATYNGVTKTKYTYRYSDECFERPILDAYKISIHHSYRENGQVKKKQWAICTMSYYDIIEYCVEDKIVHSEIEEKAKEMGITKGKLYKLIYDKLNPLEEEIRAEYEQTEEYKTHEKHQAILTTYRKVKAEFEKLFGEDTYDYIYDVFGNLRNEEELKKVMKAKEKADEQRKAQEEYTRRSYEEYQRRNYNNYSSGGSSYYTNSYSNYTEDEKKMLHEIYRLASKKFHPDVCGDDGSKMKFLTKLKEQWGL